jgi:hypothetical protein
MTARRNAVRVSKVMRQVFGLAELRPGHHAVIEAVAWSQCGICDNCRGLAIRASRAE